MSILQKIRERLRKQGATDASRLSEDPETSQPHPYVNLEWIQSPSPSVPFEESDALPPTTPEVHHISNSTSQKENIYKWVDFHERNRDQAVMV